MPNDEDRPPTGEGSAEDAEGREDESVAENAEALREISDEELKKILAEHKKWRETQEEEGQRADLSHANLQGTDLRDADLLRANLQGANLQGADLQKAKLQEAKISAANLQGANLYGAYLNGAILTRSKLEDANLNSAILEGADLVAANLQGADLGGADLRAADLRDADLLGVDLADVLLDGANLLGTKLRNAKLNDATLTDVRGLQSGQLGGADLLNAKLPDDIAKFEGLGHVTEISKHARTIFLAVVGGCVFSWLTIATTTDVALLTNSGSSPLPIIQTKVPIAGFYWAAPAILLALYAYLHLYLQRLWEGMASLPAIFPDGRTLDERAYPWLLSGIVRAHVPRLKDKPQARLGLQVAVSLVTAWMFVPGTLGLFWLRYLPRHDWLPTLWLGALFVVAVAFGTASYRLATTTLRGEPTTKPDAETEDKAVTPTWKRALRVVRGCRPDRYSTIAAVFGLLISLGAIEGRPDDPNKPTYDFRTWIYALAEIAGYYPALEMRGEDVSFKPDDWSGLGKGPDELSPADLAEVKGAQLAGSDLKYARARGAFFLKANLRDANLQGVVLRFANLRGADLRGADLREANFDGANLQESDLRGAKVQGATLGGANFVEAKFGAFLGIGPITNLADANLISARGLTQEQLDQACGDDKTKLSKGLTIKFCPGLDLSGRDLSDFKGLTQAQLDESCGNDKTALPEGLTIKPCPDEEPTTE